MYSLTDGSSCVEIGLPKHALGISQGGLRGGKIVTMIMLVKINRLLI